MFAGIEKYYITPNQIYNWDEKGFILGFMHILQRIMPKEALKSGRIRSAIQDGNREFISLLACISAIRTALPPALIYQGSSNDLQDSWVQDVDSSESVYFASTANGWSCDKLGLDWLQRIFHRHTQYGRHGLGRRLLIVDGHSSHVNLKFINAADQLNILVLILPPHTTQRLQPLDVGLFGPLAKAYSAELLQISSNSQYMTSIIKRMF